MYSQKLPPKRPGRHPTFGPDQKRPMTRVNLNMGDHVWKALEKYARNMDELSLSSAARRLLSDKLVELGYLKREKAQYLDQTKNGENGSHEM